MLRAVSDLSNEVEQESRFSAAINQSERRELN
jgi:hypothetical protein